MLSEREMPDQPLTLAINLVSMGEPSTFEVLESIAEQSRAVTETILVTHRNRTTNLFAGIDRKAGLRVLETADVVGLLEARRRACRATTSDFTLLLDSTRILNKNAVEQLLSNLSGFDMAIVFEESIANSYWGKLAELDKRVTSSPLGLDWALKKLRGSVLPRFFRTCTLNSAFDLLEASIPPALFSKVVYGDHHLIYEAASRVSARMGVLQSPVIRHREDATLEQIIKKYFRYGKTQRFLRQLSADWQAKQLRSHRRVYSGIPLSVRVALQPLYIARTVSFGAGYVLGPMRVDNHSRT